MPLSGITGSTALQLALGPAVVYRGLTPIGVSVGDVSVEETQEFRQPRIGGLSTAIEGLDRMVRSSLRITGTFLEHTAAQSALATAGVNVAGDITPLAASQFLTAGQYDTDIRFVVARGDGGF